MYLAKSSLWTLVRRQFEYKLQVYRNLFTGLMLAQLLAVFFSLGGSGKMTEISGNMVLRLKSYNGNIILIFTILWSLAAAMTITTLASRDMDFTFVTNRLSSNLSSICYLLAIATAGALTSTFCAVALRVLVYLGYGSSSIQTVNFFLSPWELIVYIFAMYFYILLFMSLGYFAGVLMRIHRVFMIIIPAAVIFFLFSATSQGHPLNTAVILHFFTRENSLPLFALKAVAAAGLLFCLSKVLSDRMEVRK